MPQQTLNNGATFGEQRGKINENFTELYSEKQDELVSGTNTRRSNRNRPYQERINNLNGGTCSICVHCVYNSLPGYR